MDADEIVPLTAEAINQLLEARRGARQKASGDEKRRVPRWAFPGAVEVWVPAEGGGERHVLGVCHNLTERGVGVRVEETIKVGATMSIAIHQPERSFHGQGTVRHCTAREGGYLVGFEFVFEGA
ncbi:MAG TPA: PilZ domain-containing protein [Phycisphaerae bacterium]|nr:PilZ domain-containing protein [Phycisphaerae bacterium]